MELKYNMEFEDETIVLKLKKFINQIYKLLPSREEQSDWKKPLSTILEEFSGFNSLMDGHNEQELFTILCKLEGLRYLNKPEDFFLYRRTIFECLNLIQEVINQICLDQKI